MFRTQNLCPGGKNVFDFMQSHFCFRAAKFVFATHVSRPAKLGNICLGNNVPSLARPILGSKGRAPFDQHQES